MLPCIQSRIDTSTISLGLATMFYDVQSTLNSAISVGHNNSLEPTSILTLMWRINVGQVNFLSMQNL